MTQAIADLIFSEAWRPATDTELEDVWAYCRQSGRIFNGCTMVVLRERYGAAAAPTRRRVLRASLSARIGRNLDHFRLLVGESLNGER